MPPNGGKRTPLDVSYSWGQSADLSQFNSVFQPDRGIFSPGLPVAPPDPAPVRGWDYPVGVNLVYTPRAYEPITFAELRALADGHDITRLAIETRKDQIEKLNWTIKPRGEKTEAADAQTRIDTLTDFFRFPDGDTPFATWLRLLLEDVLVLDAPALEVRRNRGGGIVGLDVVDGSTITVLVDDTGRRPQSPAPAYEQVIHGRPWKLLTADDLIYLPRNPRPHKRFGFSPVEQIIMTVNIAIRRQVQQLQHFTDGNVPPGMVNAPEGWNADQIQQFQMWFDSVLAGNTGARARLIWGPNGAKYQAFSEPPLKDDQDEWLARVVCYAFSLPPTAFTRQVNRATAESAQEAALEEGLAPLMGWVKRLADEVIQRRMGHADLEFAWSNDRPLDAKDASDIIDQKLRSGRLTLNEARDLDGTDPVDDGDEPMIYLPTGPVLLRDVLNPPEPPMPSAPAVGQQEPPAPEGNARTVPEVGKTAAAPFIRARTPIARGPGRNAALMTRVERSLTQKLAGFFAARARHVSAQIADRIGLSKAPDDGRPLSILDGVDLGDWDVLIDPTADELAQIYSDGTTRALRILGIEDGTTTTNEARAAHGLPPRAGGDAIPAIVDQVNDRAVSWAKDRAADLVTQINGNTRDMLRATVTDAIEGGWSAAKLADAIRDSAGFSDARAERIARTEIIAANNNGNLDAYKSSGVAEGKEWLTARDALVEETCLLNEEAGPIGLDEDFPSGDASPPAHPNCRCSVIPVLEPLESRP